MEDLLIQILSEFGYPVFRQGSLTENEAYPDSFFTFWNNSSYDGSHYDNEAISTVWDFDVNFYSTDPEKTYSLLEEVRVRLKRKKFIISGKGYDVASDEATHTGRGMNVLFLEMN